MNQGDIESDMALRTEETKAEVKGEVERQRNPESVLFQPMWGPPPKGVGSGPLTPTKREPTTQIVEEPQDEEEDPGRNSSGTT